MNTAHLSISAALLLALTVAPTAVTRADPLNPLDFPSLGTATLAPGAYTINTDDNTFRNSANAVLYTGTPDAIGTCVFAFTGFSALVGTTITAAGDHPLAILSSGNLTFSGTINLNGAGASGTVPGNQGGTGGGIGGFGAQIGLGGLASGPGGGGGGVTGGAFGGDGGGDMTYGNLLLRLEAGSGGTGGAANALGFRGGGGGQGGGALELGALGTLSINQSTINANGGNGAAGEGSGASAGGGGGGGSGGGILLHGVAVALPNVANRINAAGGNGVQAGSGGGGRITVQYSLSTVNTTGLNVAPGVTNSVTPSAGVATTPRAILTATNLDFGDVLVGTSKTLGMLVSNTGDAGTTINGRFPTAAAPFARISASGNFSGLHVNDFKAATYTFTPTALGPFTQTLTFLSNGGNRTVTISGTGTAPPTSFCAADLGIQGGFPGHDGALDNNDFIAFIDAFFSHTGCP